MGIPLPAELPASSAEEQDEVVALMKEYYGGTAERRVLVHKLLERGYAESTIRVKIHRAIKRGLIHCVEEGSLLVVN